MATTPETAEYILDQLAPLDVRVHRMFGEYALYCRERVVGFICDDELFVKPVEGTRELTGSLEAGHPYPGSKE